ncbi:hypothetical protein [Phaeovulum sp.]|uniref:hypothetical protein n=1 Tax=Phaeovulum sp. TaxID=2934796 RepID=UPI0039E62BCF
MAFWPFNLALFHLFYPLDAGTPRRVPTLRLFLWVFDENLFYVMKKILRLPHADTQSGPPCGGYLQNEGGIPEKNPYL